MPANPFAALGGSVSDDDEPQDVPETKAPAPAAAAAPKNGNKDRKPRNTGMFDSALSQTCSHIYHSIYRRVRKQKRLLHLKL